MKSSDLPKVHGHASTILESNVADGSGIFSGTSVMTLDGALSVEFLSPGDRVVTRSGAVVVKKILSGQASVETCTISFKVLDIARPEDTIVLPTTQKILLRGQLAKQLTGKIQALLPVSDLTRIEGVTRQDPAPMQMFSLIFDDDQICYADGLELLCPADLKRTDSVALI